MCTISFLAHCGAITASADEPTNLPNATAADFEWFEREVRPLLAEHCYSCHSSTVEHPKGGLRLDSLDGILTGGDSGPAAVAGDVTGSAIVQAVQRTSLEMPPDKPLNPRDQAKIERWVKLGLPWPQTTRQNDTLADWATERAAVHWAWQSPPPTSPPQLDDDRWSTKPLDRFVAAELAANKVAPAVPCEPLTLLRRLSFDLTGLPPAADDVAQATEQFAEPDYTQLVDRLLSSPQFGVQWGRHWFDLVRYSESLGHEFDYSIRHAWQYRDATVDGLNTDMSYADFVREHLAGDLLAKPRIHPLTGVNQSLAATTWWWMGDTIHAPVDIKADWAARIDNQIDVMSKAFIGLTISCARCHDHKFDAISLKDYYGLAGVMKSSRRLYHATDPFDRIAQHESIMATQLAQADDLARQAFSESASQTTEVRDWLNTVCQSLRAQPAKLDAWLPTSSPWFAIRPVVNDDFTASLSKARKQLGNQRAEYLKWQAESPLFANFAEGLPAGWTVQTASQNTAPLQLDVQPQSATWDWFAGKLPVPAGLGMFSSQRYGRHAYVTLRSPTFEVQRPVVCLKLQGKSALSVVSVDNYYMHEFTGLLFGDLRKAIDQPSAAGWVTHRGDLNKYLGQPAFLSLEDEGAAWFELQEVRFADRGPPAESSLQAEQLLSDEFSSQAELFDQLESHLAAALERLSSEQADASAISWVHSAMDLADQIGVAFPLPRSRELSETAERLQQLDASAPAPTVLTTIAEGTPCDSEIAIRGNPATLGDVVPRGCFARLIETPTITADSSGRWELAQSLSSPTHPLSSRVIVNRVWHHLLGTGLVSSTDNFGVLGGRPSHPQLLDYLSTEFVRHDWSIKWLVREIVLSQTYRLSSTPTEEQLQSDADGRLLSHRAVKRLTAESLRDSLLATADSLNRNLAGVSIPIHLNEQMTGRGRPGASGPLDGGNRRSLYIEVRRNFLDPLLLAFDFPMPATCTGNRNVSNVPAQALGLLNDPLVNEMANRWTQRILAIKGDAPRITAMFIAALGRQPTTEELAECQAYVSQATGDAAAQQQVWNELAHVLLNTKEFSYVR